MDTLARLKLRPLGVWSTPWQADSLLGALANAWARTHGVSALKRDFLDPWLANEPLFVISDALPGDSFPAPANLPLWDWPEDRRKEVKKLRWLSAADFRAVQTGSRPSLKDASSVSLSDHIRMRNSISRLSDTPNEVGGLFEVSYSKLSDPNAGLTIYARAAANGLDILTQTLEILGQAGYGARASSGHGGFEIEGDPEPCAELDDVPDANGFVSLSTYQPAPRDPVEGYWRNFVKYGKMAPEFHHIDVIHKRPQVMLEAGACFRTQGGPRPFYGGPIPPERLLGEGVRERLAARDVHPVQAAFALAVPMIWREGE